MRASLHPASSRPPDSSFEDADLLDDAELAEHADALRALNRSPHPYHSTSVPHASSKLAPSPAASAHPTPVHSDIERAKHSNHGVSRKRRGYSESPSASGTEADDEAYAFVKALPPAPVRPRKGLRDTRGEGLPSPGASTSVDSLDGFVDPGSGHQKPPTKRRAAQSQRRRVEVIRRTTELALVLLIGGLGLLRGGAWDIMWNHHRREYLSFVTILVVLGVLYPGRLLRNIRKRRQMSAKAALDLIGIPSSFDPAPLIYPPWLPTLVTISLLPFSERTILPNIVLGLSTLPPALIPFHSTELGPSMAHWTISSIPLILSEYTRWPSKRFPSKPYGLVAADSGLHGETIVCLYALHQALLVPLHYLTTTSLLPAELHLLSISLINLLFFVESPQMSIVKGVLWISGLGIFILCSHVLRWGVALARVPKWRMKRAGRLISARETFLSALRQAAGSRRPKGSHDSDADEDGLTHYRKAPRLAQATQYEKTRSQSTHAPAAMSAVESPRKGNGTTNGGIEKPIISRRRSNTLPTPDKPNPTVETFKPRRRKAPKPTEMQAFLSLTPAQATLRKWMYAAYFYGTLVVLVLGPVRSYVAEYALGGYDPFGWAIGYLFGDFMPLRDFVSDWKLGWWIPLSDRAVAPSPAQQADQRAEYFRSEVAGQATTRLLLFAYYFGTIAAGIVVVLCLPTAVEVDTRRKVFHGIMVAMLLPTVYIDPAYIALALGLVLAVFLLLDLIRASQLPPLAKPIAQFLTPYVDGRDLCGPVVVSHIFLLIGCAIPLWLSLAGTELAGDDPWTGWTAQTRDVSMVAGIVCVGMGDAAASLVGRRIGRRKWIWPGGKSIEGSVAFAAAVTAGLLFGKAWLRLGQWSDGVTGVTDAAHAAQAASGASNVPDSEGQGRWTGGAAGWTMTLCKAVIAASGASLMEAVLTGGNDNVVVPVVLWLLVRGTGL